VHPLGGGIEREKNIKHFEVSRSLGPEFGGSIGIIFYVANIVNASMNCVGLAETIVAILSEDYNFKLIDGGINDVRIYGLGKQMKRSKNDLKFF
jgi:hypothetical protein